MAKGQVASKAPAVLELEAGTYMWCQCGKSSKQPFCDGSHAGSEFSPVKLLLEEAKKVVLCQCKQTNNQPFCDGAHSSL